MAEQPASASSPEWDATTYHRVASPHLDWGRRVLDTVDLVGDESVIDAGCGTGHVTAELLERVRHGRVIALDRSANMLGEARRHLRPPPATRLSFVQADLLDLPFHGTADLVLSTATFHWVLDHEALFRSVWTALRPGGRLVAQCGGAGNLERLFGRVDALTAEVPYKTLLDGWTNPVEFPDPDTTAGRLRSAGFVEVQAELVPAPTPLGDAASFREFVGSVVLRLHLGRVPDPLLCHRLLERLAQEAERDDPPYCLDYWRLNLRGRRPLAHASCMEDDHTTPVGRTTPAASVDFERGESEALPAGETVPLSGLPRVLGDVGRDIQGPTLICLGGIHGNEPSGILALRRIFRTLETSPGGIQGRFIGLAGNRQALARRRRFLADDLNRIWLPDRIERLRGAAGPLAAEDRELADLDRHFEFILGTARGPVFCLDLHSTSGGGLPFASLDDTLANRALAFEIPVTHVMGLEEQLIGTVTDHLNVRGVNAIGFEAGQHDDPESIDRAEAAIWILLESAGVLRRGTRPEVAPARRRLSAGGAGRPAIVEVRYRHPIDPADGFRMAPGFESFQTVTRGQIVASSAAGAVTTPEAGLILMPLYQGQGEDGFFIVRSVRPLWLAISARLRGRGLERHLHRLPGVRCHPDLPGAFIVDRRRARWLAAQVFHLLGFKRGEPDRETVVMTPREREA